MKKLIDIVRRAARPAHQWYTIRRGFNYQIQQRYPLPNIASNTASSSESNALRSFFDARTEGHGITKWRHYFDIYARHFEKFRGTELEIGIYSGGSLDMWRDYFGPKAAIYGVDIQPACRVYEHSGVKVFIGDQADRSFWRSFRGAVPYLDIVVDDGDHEGELQIISLEELLPIIRPGGVSLCEDVCGAPNRFASYVHGLSRS